MEITKQKETGLSSSSTDHRQVTVPTNLSRSKALQYVKTHSEARGGEHIGVPERKTTDYLYALFLKIGALNELPEDTSKTEFFLNDFWRSLYLLNNLCPADIPFHIIIEQFTLAMVQGVVDRKGNNQSAICTAFNQWITRQDVRNRLYEIRNRQYPDRKPKELAKNATEQTIQDYSDDEIKQKIKDISPMRGIKMVDMMVKELENEAENRGLTL